MSNQSFSGSRLKIQRTRPPINQAVGKREENELVASFGIVNAGDSRIQESNNGSFQDPFGHERFEKQMRVKVRQVHQVRVKPAVGSGDYWIT